MGSQPAVTHGPTMLVLCLRIGRRIRGGLGLEGLDWTDWTDCLRMERWMDWNGMRIE